MARASRPKLVRLKPPSGDMEMAATLLFFLDYVRQGKIVAYSICLVGERDDGSNYSLCGSTADDDRNYELQLLGLMRCAESDLMRRRDERDL